jgi:bifunctional non-homologous end joining protein LigD
MLLWRLCSGPLAASGFIAPCLPAAFKKPPEGELWLHEIKHDGYRLLARRDGGSIRLFTRNGHDWSDRYPAIVAAVAALKVRSVHIDGEAVVVDEHGHGCFERLRSRAHDSAAFLYAFDLLELDGQDFRDVPLADRKFRLLRLLRRPQPGLRYVGDIQGVGGLVFYKACLLGCEGIVSKRCDSRYTSGRSRAWRKSKNPNAPAVRRKAEEDWSK